MIPAAILIACASPAVHDGDGLRCGRESVRVAGIEAPELPGSSACAPGKPAVGTPRCDFAAGIRAGNYARGLVARATRVEIQRLGKDPWCRRTVARVYLDGKEFASLMVDAGHAWRVREYARVCP